MKNNNTIRTWFTAAVAAASMSLVVLPASAERQYPSRPITTTVVWGAGGGTDSINRMIMAEMSDILDTNIRVTNMTGGVAGSIGMSHVLNQSPDGYSLAGLSESNVTAAVNGGWDKRFDVWSPFIVGGSPDIISVSTDAPFDTLEELIEHVQANPDSVNAGAGGAGSIHHLNLLALQNGTDTQFKFVPYPGSAPAQTAAATGEISVVITSVAEQASLIRGGNLKPLAMLVPDSFTLPGMAPIPSAFDSYPALSQYLPIGQAIGFAIHEEAPEEVKQTLGDAFEQAMQSTAVQDWAESNFYTLSGAHGEEARTIFSNLESNFAWTLWELGSAKVNPEQLGIAKP